VPWTSHVLQWTWNGFLQWLYSVVTEIRRVCLLQWTINRCLLWLYRNVLKTLKDYELFIYKSECYRYFQYCKQGIINEKEFRAWRISPSQRFSLTALIQSDNLLNELICYSSLAFFYIQFINQQNALSIIYKIIQHKVYNVHHIPWHVISRTLQADESILGRILWQMFVYTTQKIIETTRN